MNEERIKKAIEHLRSLDVVRDNNLSVELMEIERKRFVVLADPNGKVVRRIPEVELWTLQVVKKSEKGQLISKSA